MTIGPTLVTKVTSPRLIEVDREVLDKDDLTHPALGRSRGTTIARKTYVGGIGGGETNVSHDGNHHMLLHVERSGVETPGISEGSKSPSRKDLLKEPTNRESATYDFPLFVIRGELLRMKRTATGRR